MKGFKDFRCFFTFIIVFIALTFRQIVYAGQNSKAVLHFSNVEINSDGSSATTTTTNKTGGQFLTSFNDETPPTPPLSQQRQLRKQLRGKQRRLRKLVGEIRGIKAKLADPDADDVQSSSVPVVNSSSTLKRTKTSWRRRVMSELKRLNDQIHILSAYKPDPETNQTDLRNNKGRPNRKQKMPKNRMDGGRKKSFDFTTSSPSTVVVVTHLPPAEQDQAKIRLQIRRMRNKRKRLKKIKSMWKNKPISEASEKQTNLLNKIDVAKGEPGYQCKSHKDCRPGSCCHKISPTNSTSICFEHRLDVGTTCANSCQCVHGLNCFRTRKDKLHHKKSTHFDFVASNYDDHQHDHGQCKIATTDDVLHGEYVSNDNYTFSSLDFK